MNAIKVYDQQVKLIFWNNFLVKIDAKKKE